MASKAEVIVAMKQKMNGKGTIRVVNWKRHQHYTTDKPPWIKVYRDLLGDYDYQQLSERDRSALVGFFLLAAETGNEIPNDVAWIKRKLAIGRQPPFEELVSRGFIEFV